MTTFIIICSITFLIGKQQYLYGLGSIAESFYSYYVGVKMESKLTRIIFNKSYE